MGRSKLVALALALAVLPGAALAQAAPAATAEQAKTEAATSVKPTDAAMASNSDGKGAPQSATQAAGADAPTVASGQTADHEIGVPTGDWRLQDAVTDLGKDAHWFNNMLLIIMGIVTVVVVALLAYTIVRFRASANPVASRTSHNTLIEIIWTAVPVLILVVIAVPSFRLLANQYDPPRPDLTIKAIGHQWYWEYQYPDLGELGFDSLMLSDEEAAKRGDPRLLGVDNRLVVPAGAVVKVLTTSTDVIHSFAMPSFWVKMDAVPGRINETWFKVDRPGVYYGQCSELCGTKHAFMPIVIEVLPPAQFRAWANEKLASNKIDSTPAIQAALTDAVNGRAPAPAVAAPAAAAPAPGAAEVPASGAVASQNTTQNTTAAPAAATK